MMEEQLLSSLLAEKDIPHTPTPSPGIERESEIVAKLVRLVP